MMDLTPSLSITISLITASVLSLSFNSTRSIGIICVTALCYFYPFYVMPPVLIGTAFYLFSKR
jgi:hypothetical protein